MTTVFKQEEQRLCGEQLKVDVVASGDDLPFRKEQFDFLISSHVLEHFWDTIGTLFEWLRVVKYASRKHGSVGSVFVIVPDPCRTGESGSVTTLTELVRRLDQGNLGEQNHGHQTVFSTELIYEMVDYMDDISAMHRTRLLHVGQDDKVGNGICFVLQKESRF